MQLYDKKGLPKPRNIPLPLADGQVSDVQAAIYTSPTGIKTRVAKITLYNTSATTQTIELFLNTSGTPRKFRRVELLEDEAADVLEEEEEIVLDEGDSVEVVTTTAAVVDYYVSGETWQ